MVLLLTLFKNSYYLTIYYGVIKTLLIPALVTLIQKSHFIINMNAALNFSGAIK